MRALCVFAAAISAGAHAFADPPRHDDSVSPDCRWSVAWNCKGTWKPDSCRIALSRRADGKVFFTHHTNDRYIKAVWSSDSKRCLLLDAPDNANSYLWLFRVQGRGIATAKLDYEKISAAIEVAAPAAHRQEPAVTRSGIDKIEWPSSSQFRLHIIYNNIPVTALLDVAKPRSPKIHVTPDKET